MEKKKKKKILLVFVFICVFHLYSIGYCFSYITIVVNLYDTVHGKKNKRIVFGFCVYSIHQYLFIFCFWLLCLLVFLICTVLVIYLFFFPYITIVVNLLRK
jgi:hypothetical protein